MRGSSPSSPRAACGVFASITYNHISCQSTRARGDAYRKVVARQRLDEVGECYQDQTLAALDRSRGELITIHSWEIQLRNWGPVGAPLDCAEVAWLEGGEHGQGTHVMIVAVWTVLIALLII